MTPKPSYEELEKRIREVQESEIYYRTLFESVNDAVLVHEIGFDGKSGKFIDANRVALKRLGYTHAELLKLTPKDITTENGYKDLFEARASITSNCAAIFETIHLARNGDLIPVESHVSVFELAGQRVAVSVTRDLSERKQAETELWQSEEKFRTLVNSAPFGIQLTDLEGRIVYSNPAHHTMQGYGPHELIGRYIWDLMAHDSHRVKAREYYQTIISKKPKPTVYYNRDRTRDGREIDVQINWDYIRNEKDEITGIISIIEDITERKQAEEALRARVKEMTLLQSISLVIQEEDSFEGICQKIVCAIPNAFYYPEISCARIIYEEQSYQTENFSETKWCLSADLKVEGKSAGAVEVFYLEERPTRDEGPFIKEERNLINLCAERLGHVAERIRAKEALRESEELLSQAQKIAHTGSWRLDLTANRLTWSDEVYRIFGCEPQEFAATYEVFLDFVHPDDRTMVDEAYSLSQQEGSDGYEIEHRIVRRNSGEVRYVHERCVHQRDTVGNTTQSTGMVQDITDRKRAEEALRGSNRLLKGTFSSLMDAIFILDSETVVMDCNSAATNIFGYSREEMLGRAADFLHVDPGSLENFRQHLAVEMAEKGLLHLSDFTMKQKDGTIFPTEHSVVPLEDDNGKKIGWVSVVRNITERKQAEEQLQKSEEQFRNLYDDAPVGYFEYDLRGNITRVNRTELKMLGYTAEEMIGQSCWKFIVDEAAREQILAKLGGVSPPAIGLERTYRRKDGTTFPVLFEDRLLLDEDGHVKGIRTAIQDITERKQAEQKLQISEKGVRAKLDAVLHPEGDMGHLSLVDIIDTARIQQLMDRLYELTNIGGAIVGLDGNVVVATKMREICARFHRMHPESLENCIDSDTKLTDGIEPGQVREYRCKNNMWDIAMPIVIGDKLFGNIFIGQFFYDDEEIDYDAFRAQAHKFGFDEQTYMDALDYVPRFSRNVVECATSYYSRFAEMISSLSYSNLKLARTIEEHKGNERERENLQTQLNQAQKMDSIGRLAGGVAHDFNNMLGVILGHTEMVLDEIDPSAPLYANLQAVQQAAEHSADLTRQLLAFARKQTIAPKVIDLNKTVKGMLKMLRRLIGEDINLLWQPGRNLRPVKVDPAQIDQLLVNLCVNSRDAIVGNGKIIIETDTKIFDDAYCADHLGFLPGEYVLLEVSDDGCGIDKKTLNQIFEPFFTTKEQGKGTGLGLASVFGMVRQNNGFINVYSEPDQGTTFKIYLPVYAKKSTGVVKKVLNLPAEKGNETILLVEDESAILEMTKMMLTRLGYTVVAAATPGEAIRLAHEYRGRIDLLMTDVVMPEMNGRELAGNLLTHYPDLKRLFMSGYTANVIAHHGVLDEGVHFIQKPFSMKGLGEKLREALEG